MEHAAITEWEGPLQTVPLTQAPGYLQNVFDMKPHLVSILPVLFPGRPLESGFCAWVGFAV